MLTTIRVSLVLACAGPIAVASAQGAPSPVRYTEVVDHPLRRTVELPGTVESRRTSMVASEVEGLVVELPVEEGDRVEEGQVLARLRKVNLVLLRQAEQSRLAEARARLELAESKLHRARELFADQVVSQDALDDALAEQAAWQGRLDQHQAELQRLDVALDRSEVRAPFDGVVVERATEVGQWMQTGGHVVTLLALDDLRVLVDVPDRYFDLLAPGLSARMRFDGLPDLPVEGRVEAVIPRADLRSRTFPVQVRIPNPDGRIGAGMLAQVELSIGSSYRAALVPKDAVVRQGPQQIVYRIRDDQTVEPVPVTPGAGVGAWIAVEGGVSPGERVVTRGNERLFPGQTVEGQPLRYPLP